MKMVVLQCSINDVWIPIDVLGLLDVRPRHVVAGRVVTSVIYLNSDLTIKSHVTATSALKVKDIQHKTATN